MICLASNVLNAPAELSSPISQLQHFSRLWRSEVHRRGSEMRVWMRLITCSKNILQPELSRPLGENEHCNIQSYYEYFSAFACVCVCICVCRCVCCYNKHRQSHLFHNMPISMGQPSLSLNRKYFCFQIWPK